MAIFGKKNKKEVTSCCCGGNCDVESMVKAEVAKSQGAGVKILGSGCAKCNQLEEATKAALEQLGMDTTIEHITDFARIEYSDRIRPPSRRKRATLTVR
jgi:hypothetical protein